MQERSDFISHFKKNFYSTLINLQLNYCGFKSIFAGVYEKKLLLYLYNINQLKLVYLVTSKQYKPGYIYY